MKKHRIISFILTLVIILSTFSTTVFASTSVENNVKEDTIIKSNAITDINDCPSISVDSDILTNQLISGILQNDIDTLSIDTEKAIIIESSSKEIIDAIKSKNAFSIEGRMVDEEKQVDINQYYNFSSTSKYHIAEWAYKTEQITEEEKIDCFCELIISKNFENIDCLEGVFAEIQNYQLNNTISTELEQKIEEVFTPPFSDTNGLTREISNEKTYKSENFAVHYDGNETTEEVAQSVAEYFEEIRTEYIDYGFRTPILQLLKTRYQVYLDPDSNPDAAAACTKTGTLTNTCASYITIYSFDSLTTDVKERIAHEYFHAIQNAYNHQSTWFKEACANWGKIIIAGTSTTCDNQINSFISSTNAMMADDTKYGAVLYPLAIHMTYGGANAICSIYEAYNDYGASISDSKLRDVISEGINNTGTSAGFTEAYRRMASFLYSTDAWYSGFTPTASNWNNATIVNKNTMKMIETTTDCTALNEFDGTVGYMTSKYYNLTIPSGFEGAVKIVVDYDGNMNGRTQIYTTTTAGRHTINFDTTESDGTSTYIQPNVGNEISTIGLIVSNVAESGSIDFDVQVTFLHAGASISFSSNRRYVERGVYIGAGEYVDYNVTFGTDGTKLIQTFGNLDTKLELYSNDGTLLSSDDDDGYGVNALIRYYVYANTEYTVRVKFYNSSVSGDTKLTITPAFRAINETSTNIDSYEDIYAVTGVTSYAWATFAQKNYTRVITFAPASSGDYTFTIESDYDTYMYVIDPRSNNILRQGINYDDDSGEGMNPLLNITLDANVPYLIIYSTYNPNSLTDNVNMTLTITKN